MMSDRFEEALHRLDPSAYPFRSAWAGDFTGCATSADITNALIRDAKRVRTVAEETHCLDNIDTFQACRTITKTQAARARRAIPHMTRG